MSYTNKYQKHSSCSYGHNLQIWTNLLPQNRKSLFPWKNHSSPKSSNVFWKVLGFRKKNLARFNIDFGWWGREFANWKTESFLEFTGSSNFVSTSFDQGCGKFLKHKPWYLFQEFSIGWVLYMNRMLKQLLGRSNKDILKILSFGGGRWRRPNDHLFSP